MPSQVKVDLVAELQEQMKQSASIVMADYRGLTVAEMTDLRSQLREKGAQIRVIKNRLAKIAFADAGLPVPEEHLQGPSAFTFSHDDPITGPKVLSEYAKKNEKLEIKCGLFEGEIIDTAAVTALASMPSREELLGRLVGDLMSPVTKTAMALKATVNKLAWALQAIGEKKGAEGAS